MPLYILTSGKILTKMSYYLLLFNVGLINILLFTGTLLLVVGDTFICEKIYNRFTFKKFILLRIDNYSCKCLITTIFFNFFNIVSTRV